MKGSHKDSKLPVCGFSNYGIDAMKGSTQFRVLCRIGSHPPLEIILTSSPENN
ncbi:hypothetical protein SLEP1_g20476 [Rubroshorea leprosula]|uniref:Uncharacterized protein n=1 Tax=Rubroshorea leprosula TaxID=152421 RepID=A0AAV5JES9_9ROSI|nr:hypothetical protein SLEP1_g20476 [Rubroshorea leprosula]